MPACISGKKKARKAAKYCFNASILQQFLSNSPGISHETISFPSGIS
jgi:hypothetical protein